MQRDQPRVAPHARRSGDSGLYKKEDDVKSKNKSGNKPIFNKDDGEVIDYEEVND